MTSIAPRRQGSGTNYSLLAVVVACGLAVTQAASAAEKQSAWERYENTALEEMDAGNPKASAADFQRAIDWAQKAGQKDKVALSKSNLGALHYITGNKKEADRYLTNAINIYRTLPVSSVPDMESALYNLANIKREQHQLAESEKLLKECLNVQVHGRDTNSKEALQPLAALANLYDAEGKRTEATKEFELLLVKQQKILGYDHQDVLETLNILAQFNFDAERYSKAEQLSRQALKIARKKPGKGQAELTKALNNLGNVCLVLGSYTEAEALYKEELKILEQNSGTESVKLTTVLIELGHLYHDSNNFSAAEKAYKRALIINQKVKSAPSEISPLLNNIADIYREQQRFKEASALYQQALAIDVKAHGPNDRSVASVLNNLGLLRKAQGNYSEGENYLTRALKIWQNSSPASSLDIAKASANLATVYTLEGKYSLAEPLCKTSLAAREHLLGANHPDVASSLENYAELLNKTNRPIEAAKLNARAKAVRTIRH
jgi:tetratricopeptide (TPR) repeat protein